MLARVIAMAVCLLSVSVTSRCSIETAEEIGLGFGMEASFRLSQSMLKRNSCIFKHKGTSVWNVVKSFGKFCFGISIVETCYRLSSTKMERDKLGRRLSTELIIPPSSDSRPLQFITVTGDRQALSAARFRRTGQLATADTCC